MHKIIYNVSGMTCGGCVNRVKTVLQTFGQEVTVTLTPPQAIISQPTADITELNQALNTVGHYTLTEHIVQPISAIDEPSIWWSKYRPLLLVFGYITLVCVLNEWTQGSFKPHRLMANFMAGFFLCFSFFKFIDLSGFARSYSEYDLLARRVPSYGYCYPFIELALGIGYWVDGSSLVLNSITFTLMLFSTLGVLIAVLTHQNIRCACLGTVFNLPMSTVTVVENALMALMALLMLMT